MGKGCAGFYKRVCRRCGNIFGTPHRHGKICISCIRLNGNAANYRIKKLKIWLNENKIWLRK